MDADFAKRWVADLRDPANKQCTSMLFDGTGYCCLGRAAVLSGAKLVPMKVESDYGDGLVEGGAFVVDGSQCEDGTGGEQEALTSSIAQKIGMANVDGLSADLKSIIINGVEYQGLADANDKGCTFPQIADWIEQNYLLL